MKNKKIIYRSFLLRIWYISNTDRATGINNLVLEVESVQSGDIWKFNTLEELFQHFKEQLDT